MFNQCLDYFNENYQVVSIFKFVHGSTLRQLLEEYRLNGKTVSEKDLLRWLIQILMALNWMQRLEGSGFVHTDLRPEAFMITKENDVKMIELGIIPRFKAQLDDPRGLHKAPRDTSEFYKSPEEY